MNIRRALVYGLTALLLAGCSGDRFGDPDVIDEIQSSTDCAELQEWADNLLAVNPYDDREFDQAVGYSNAANDRMDEIGCR